MMRERLIELLTADLGDKYNPVRNFKQDMVENLADYLFENGVVVLPCKVGDTVFDIDGEPREVKNIEYFAKENEFNVWCGLNYFKSENIGKTVFPTKEEAEKALESLQIKSQAPNRT